MRSSTTLFAAAASAALLLGASAANAAVTVNWTDWTSPAVGPPTASTHVDGMITVGATTIDVDYDGALYFTQTSGGTDYWAASVADYTDGNVNRPTGSDIISLNAGGLKTLTFSQAVVNPYLAFSSWNGNVVNFSAPFTIVGQGCGHWGCGTFAPNIAGTGFTGQGEVHGILQFQGTFTQLTFTDSGELWHGFTVGVEGVAVPEPTTWALMIAGFGGVGAMLRRRRVAAAL